MINCIPTTLALNLFSDNVLQVRDIIAPRNIPTCNYHMKVDLIVSQVFIVNNNYELHSWDEFVYLLTV